MKKLFILLLVLTAASFAQWRYPYPVTATSLSGGLLVDQNNIWVCGAYNSIYKSTDGGISWVKKYNTEYTSNKTSDICFINSNTGVAVGEKGTILKTTDGGESWNLSKLPDTTYAGISVKFFDENNGIVLTNKTSSGRIYRTTDGAATWSLDTSFSAQMLNMKFWDSQHGVAIEQANNIYYTTDGGDNWNKAPTPAFPPITYSKTSQWGLQFVSATTVYSCGWGSTAIGYEPTIFMKSTDGGASWTVLEQKAENSVYVNLKSMYFKDENTGFAVGGSNYPGTVICKTTDGGVNWAPLPCFSGFTANKVMGYDDVVIVIGDGGNIIRSTDFGETWTMINKYPAETTYSLSFLNDNIYSAGTSGVFFKSTDAGKTFNSSYMTVGNVCLTSSDMQFLNENLGYSTGQKGHTTKTTDGGNTWFQVMKDTMSNFISNNALCFLNENTGFVVGKYGSNVDAIYKTTNGGTDWTQTTNKAFQELYNIAFANENQGAACGAKSAMLYTTDQGESWNTSTLNTTEQLGINSVKFYDGLNGIAAGVGIILKTTDGGANWTKTSDATFKFTVKNLFIKDPVTFYAVGTKCVLLSTDEGNTWTNIIDTAWANPKGLSVNDMAIDKDGYIWIAGLGGVYTNAPVIDALHESQIQPASFTLEQNYPNPFNPSTNIKFNLKESGMVSLKLYDVLGRVVKDIFNGNMSSGAHTVQLNASGLASGTYIYTLKVNNQVISHKMTLIK